MRDRGCNCTLEMSDSFGHRLIRSFFLLMATKRLGSHESMSALQIRTPKPTWNEERQPPMTLSARGSLASRLLAQSVRTSVNQAR